jgi:glycosyltransferase involved in cell wall biosynthesis
MSASLRLLITADPELPVPPALYGGIERVIALLVDGLVARGHDVALLAHRDSQVSGRLMAYGATDGGAVGTLRNSATLLRAMVQHRPQVVHSFGRLAMLAPILATRGPKIMSYQRAVTPRSVAWGRRLSRDQVTFVSCSRRLVADLADNAGWRVIYNAVDVDRYAFRATVPADAPLVFLGRIEAIKGPHIAIDVARRAGRRLILAGNVPRDHQAFFEQAIRPHLDGVSVTYLGPVDDRAKSELLSNAAALLMPVLWEEPFGIVMAEALACGTPVIGFARGAVPEVIDDGVTGFVCRTDGGMNGSLKMLDRLSRPACRLAAETRFSQKALLDAYEALYLELVAQSRTVSRMVEQPGLISRQD